MHTPILLDYHAIHGTSKIRSFYIDENLYISLEDVVLTLAKTNTAINVQGKTGLGQLVKAQRDVLDSDEYKHFPVIDDLSAQPRTEVFITEPGLYRIISRDSTPASKSFQRWIFHEVIPAVRKYGTYPAPVKQGGSEIMSLAQTLAQHTNLLIKEIEEREKLANETRLRFEETERQLEEINQKIETITLPSDNSDLIDVQNYCSDRSIIIDLQHLRAMCAKLCLEQGITYNKKKNPESHMDYLYPPLLINEAIKLIRS
ncbi:BRO-N domain-containing protein [Pseudomonas zeae]|uniref:BRO family protein n=1 Tax=Pseudomonas zeae TaxID=2745510 RepID=A0ABU5BJW4_9PSED|nr:BRO family protein [Pseudomonas zeae]MDX9676962.1 BRO family protein [Pseudomonas zeae]